MFKHILKDALECIDMDCTAHLPLKILKIKKKITTDYANSFLRKGECKFGNVSDISDSCCYNVILGRYPFQTG